ncbi:hypothetical protein GGI01_001762 [Coemansia sp. RSA 376]|nr:hypothetical protein GGI14_001771 [Coemansia sp. S680]KAJ2037459.1 hypothetical protein GGI08_008479 [Coemansia sp. S2]KAJ2106398.1 hypothetical protein IW146_007801 [Coemansia sp. RSA 922]KAJ2262136.1 hypothetical protein GGI01_001762 [Coemansia sp. RSA 376]KAJ2468731.1 hypothetical protein GGI03_000815 [Coemansia sp. RSA 2337]
MQAHRETPEAITILRVKRKRGQEPIEALMVEPRLLSRQKTNHTGLVFALGETLTESDFSDTAKRQALQDRLTQLSNHTEVEMEDTEQPTRPMHPPAAQFRVLSKQQVKVARGIPQVLSAADIRNHRAITMFDAINEEDYVPPSTRPDPYAEIALGAPRGAVDDLVPLVRDYLSLDHSAPEYVYDFYYARQQQSADSMLHVGAVTWIDDTEDQADSSSEDGDEDEDSNSEGYYANDYPDDESVNSRDSYYYSDEEREHIQDGAVDICDMNNTMYQDEDY